MFVKERSTPIPLQKMDASIGRLPPTHSKLPILQKKTVQAQKGFSGERRLDYHLESLPEDFSILNDVTLSLFDKLFQIDSLIISAYAIYLIEVKNFHGTITFNTTLNQFIRDDGKQVSGYKYPITQVQHTQFQLLRWLQKHKLAGLPIYFFIAIAEPSTIFKVVGNEEVVKKVVGYVDEIPLRIMKVNHYLAQQHSEGNHQLKNQIVSTIMQKYEDFDKDVLGEIGLSKSELLPGVQCPKCRSLGMKRLYSKWYCDSCGAYSKDAHKKALNDYFLLINNHITNKECREFLKVNSRHVAKKLLMNSNFTFLYDLQKWTPKYK